MSPIIRRIVLLALCIAALAPVTAAEAQWYGHAGGPPPLYPYKLQPGQAYAVEVAPGTYIIHHPSNRRAYPAATRRVRHTAARHRAAPKPERSHAYRARIKELRRHDAKRAAKLAAERAAKRVAKSAVRHDDKHAGRKPVGIKKTHKIGRKKPRVIKTRRAVNVRPKVITRRHYVDDAPTPRPRRRHLAGAAPNPAGNADPRVIHADAEITILGPDRMSIRLIRKDGQKLDISAKAPRTK